MPIFSGICSKFSFVQAVKLCLAIGLFFGCTPSKKLILKDTRKTFMENSIICTKLEQTITFEALIEDLQQAGVVYIGERHPDRHHHDVQLKITKALYEIHPDLLVGVEMFDKSYALVLKQWSRGDLDESEFLNKTHWYANWRYPFDLYRDIFVFIKENQIPLIGLNIPFHIPSKIAIGGIKSLLEHDRKFLPENIDTGIDTHRQYVQKIYEKHDVHGMDNFEAFYEAQCVWEDTMAEEVAVHSGDNPMVVLAGNGHIIYKFGIPQRAYHRNPVPFKTVYPAAAGQTVDPDYADYIWVTPEPQNFKNHP